MIESLMFVEQVEMQRFADAALFDDVERRALVAGVGHDRPQPARGAGAHRRRADSAGAACAEYALHGDPVVIAQTLLSDFQCLLAIICWVCSAVGSGSAATCP